MRMVDLSSLISNFLSFMELLSTSGRVWVPLEEYLKRVPLSAFYFILIPISYIIKLINSSDSSNVLKFVPALSFL